MALITGTEGIDVPVEVLVLTKGEIESLLSYQEVIDVDEEVYRARGRREVMVPAKEFMYIDPPDNRNCFIAMPAFDRHLGCAGVKWTPDYFNQQPGIPTLWGAVIILNREDNGQPYAIMDGTAITNVRTGAHSSVAAKYLARKDSRVIAVIGCGAQARTHVHALSTLFNIEAVQAFDARSEAVDAFARETGSYLGVQVRPAPDAKQACQDADVICVVTTAKTPVIMEPWVPPGCFVTGLMGFLDMDTQIAWKVDKWVVGDGETDPAICRSYGFDVDYSRIYADMGELTLGRKPGRENDRERTLYTHFGMGAHDLAVANLVYSRAVESGVGRKMALI
ncbi:MAG: ornithine cyclodeaminase family protein [Chloroflexota bacterium]